MTAFSGRAPRDAPERAPGSVLSSSVGTAPFERRSTFKQGPGQWTWTLAPPRVLGSPDGDDVGEEQQEAEEVAVPRACEALQRDHDERQGHEGHEQRLGQPVELQVQQTDLKNKVRAYA